MTQRPINCFRCGRQGHVLRYCDQITQTRRHNEAVLARLEKNGCMKGTWDSPEETSKKNQRQDFTFKCFSCNGFGHMILQCPTAICFNCGGKGHIAKSCPNKSFGSMCQVCYQIGHTIFECPLEMKKCYQCGKKGHLERYCPLKPKKEGKPKTTY